MEDDPRQCREVFTMKGDFLTTLAESACAIEKILPIALTSISVGGLPSIKISIMPERVRTWRRTKRPAAVSTDIEAFLKRLGMALWN